MVDITELLTDIKQLSEIPDFALALHHKVEELKIALSDHINYHREIESIINQYQFQESDTVKGVRFELVKIGDSLWIPAIPGVKDNEYIYTIIPKQLIRYIVSQKIEKGLIVMKRNLTLKTLRNRTFDLSFEKISARYYIGLLHEQGGIEKVIKVPYPCKEGKRAIEIDQLRLLVKYFEHYPYYFRHVFNNFLKVWKKVLDKKAAVAGA